MMVRCLIYTKINKNISCTEEMVQTLTSCQWITLHDDKDEKCKFVQAQQ
jgi:hypothetical protein